MRPLATRFAEMAVATVVRSPAFVKAPAGKQADAPVPHGNPSRGAEIVTGKGQCLTCHRVRGAGSRLGPDLTHVGTSRRHEHVHASLLDANAEILPENGRGGRQYVAVTAGNSLFVFGLP